MIQDIQEIIASIGFNVKMIVLDKEFVVMENAFVSMILKESLVKGGKMSLILKL